MRDNSLMNHRHLKAEIEYLETIRIPAKAARAHEIQSRISKAFKHFHYTSITDNGTYILSKEQVDDVLNALAGCEVDLTTNSFWDSYYLKGYRSLLTDRRWLIASKLKFLAK